METKEIETILTKMENAEANKCRMYKQRLTSWYPKIRIWMEQLKVFSAHGYKFVKVEKYQTDDMRINAFKNYKEICAQTGGIYKAFGTFQEDYNGGFLGIKDGAEVAGDIVTDGHDFWGRRFGDDSDRVELCSKDYERILAQLSEFDSRMNEIYNYLQKQK